MARIDLISVSEQYARNQQLFEDFAKQYHVPRGVGAGAFLTVIPTPRAVDLLTGATQRKSWALVSWPPQFSNQQINTSLVAPSLGPIELQDNYQAIIDEITDHTTDETTINEGVALKSLLVEREKNHDIVTLAEGRMAEFKRG